MLLGQQKKQAANSPLLTFMLGRVINGKWGRTNFGLQSHPRRDSVNSLTAGYAKFP